MEHLKIQIPEGHEIDTEKSDLANGVITFKKKVIRGWRGNPEREIKGYYISSLSTINSVTQRACVGNLNTFATRKQAESALAMAQLSQIIANDPRFGGPVTDEEWNMSNTTKYVIYRIGNNVSATGTLVIRYTFLAFHTAEQRNLFLEENIDLIKQYFML